MYSHLNSMNRPVGRSRPVTIPLSFVQPSIDTSRAALLTQRCSQTATGTRPKRLHISNIPFKMNNADLEFLFQTFGPVTDAEVVSNEKGSKGFGFVTFACESDAKRAKLLLNGTVIEGRRIQVNDAMPRNKFRISPAPALLRVMGQERNDFLTQWSARHTLVPMHEFHSVSEQQHQLRNQTLAPDSEWYYTLKQMYAQRQRQEELMQVTSPQSSADSQSSTSSPEKEYRLFA